MSDIKHFKFKDIDLIAMLSHDLKTPIFAQIRALNLLHSGLCGDFSKEADNLIVNLIASNKYMQCLVENILLDYKIKNKNFDLLIEKHDFRKTLEEVICSIGILSEINEQKISINYPSDNYIKSYDEIEIKRVIVNLLANAFKYSKENSTIKLEIKANLNSLVFKIESEVAFYANKQEKLQEKKKYGFGLGLIICEKIISLHEGEFLPPNINDGFYSVGFILR